MNTDQAKKTVNINDYLSNAGHKPVSQRGNHFRYYSPFREERTASFDVDNAKNTFIDWGTGQTGTIIDLVMILSNTDVSGALEILDQYNGEPSKSTFSFTKHESKQTRKSIPGTIEKITDPSLINYLISRKINPEAWEGCPYLFQYTYKRNNYSKQVYHNLAWQNDKSGYELNNRNFKSCLLAKDITTIAGPGNTLNIFEGFMDYLSALTYYQTKQLEGTTIVLNSVALSNRVTTLLGSFHRVNAFLDNDKAGKQAFALFANHQKNIINHSETTYPDNKDFNDFIIQTIK